MDQHNAVAEGCDTHDNDWYSLYHDGRFNSESRDASAQEVLLSFKRIRLQTDGLREKDFQLSEHVGGLAMGSSPTQVTEKRLVRALFNEHHKNTPHPELGAVLDYEVPLKATQNARHGDIDLLTHKDGNLLLIEVKPPSNRGVCLLKAILQIYTYTRLVLERRSVFIKEFGFNPPSTPCIRPSLLVASHLYERDMASSEMKSLIKRMNEDLLERNAGKFIFFKWRFPYDFGRHEYLVESDGKLRYRDGCHPHIAIVELPST